MKPTHARIAELWCRLMHREPMWPSHGQYECRRCEQAIFGLLARTFAGRIACAGSPVQDAGPKHLPNSQLNRVIQIFESHGFGGCRLASRSGTGVYRRFETWPSGC